MTQSSVDRVIAGAQVDEWRLPAEAEDALRTAGIPAVAASWKKACIQRGEEPVLRFEGLQPLYEIVRRVSLWNPDRAYSCFGVEAETGRVFQAHPETPTDEVSPRTAFGRPRLVNNSIPSFLRVLDLEIARYVELFGAPSAQHLAEMPETIDPDDEVLWSVSEKYLWRIREIDPEAFDDPQGYWRNLYFETWEQVGRPAFRRGPGIFE
ncbi:hypothetical protein GCM10010421_40330 [Streptomyces glaucus]|uniref:SUKH-4 immunity protein of toxin-antitoxin system n=1 Tax=Streptomyces glaucus TaxID=284029 RepID=A0ABP5X7P0_9ACTN